MSFTAATVIAESAEGAANHGLAPIWWGVISFLILLSLLAVTYAFRNFGTRH